MARALTFEAFSSTGGSDIAPTIEDGEPSKVTADIIFGTAKDAKVEELEAAIKGHSGEVNLAALDFLWPATMKAYCSKHGIDRDSLLEVEKQA